VAGIGCVDCKQPLIDAVLAEQALIRERAEPYEKDKARLVKVIEQGNERARSVAQQTMAQVRDSVGTNYDEL
jgi:tryptophanyl-tRNA synthetase